MSDLHSSLWLQFSPLPHKGNGGQFNVAVSSLSGLVATISTSGTVSLYDPRHLHQPLATITTHIAHNTRHMTKKPNLQVMLALALVLCIVHKSVCTCILPTSFPQHYHMKLQCQVSHQSTTICMKYVFFTFTVTGVGHGVSVYTTLHWPSHKGVQWNDLPTLLLSLPPVKCPLLSLGYTPLFTHDGHEALSGGNDIQVLSHSWHPSHPSLLLSSASDGSLHAWQYKNDWWNMNITLAVYRWCMCVFVFTLELPHVFMGCLHVVVTQFLE